MAERRTLAIESRARDFAGKTFDNLRKKAGETARGIVSSFAKTINPFTKLKAAIGGVVAILAVRRGISFFNEIRENADVLAKTADRLSITAESLQEVAFAGRLAGVELEDVRTFFNDLSRNVAAARRGTAAQAEAFETLGISVDQFAGNTIDATRAAELIADGLQGVGDATERTNALLTIGGESATKLGALFAQGGEGIRAFADEAAALGLILSREELARVEAFNDAVEKLSSTFNAFFQRVFVEVAPFITEALEKLLDQFRDGSIDVRALAEDVSDFLIGALEGLAVTVVRVGDEIGRLDLRFRQAELFFNRFAVRLDLIRLRIQGIVDESARIGAEDAFQDLVKIAAEAREVRQELGFSSNETDRRIANVRKFFDEIEEGLKKTQDQVDRGRDRAGGDTELGLFQRFVIGAERGALAFQDFGQTVETVGQRLVQQPLSALTSQIALGIEGVKTWEDVWRDFGRQVQRIIAQVTAQLATSLLVRGILGPVAAGGGGSPLNAFRQARGGVMSGTMGTPLPVQNYAQGGIARSPQVAIFGEGPTKGEAFVPLPDGRSIPVTMSGGGGLQVTIYALDSKDVRRILLENRQTLGQIRASDFENKVGQRQMVQRAVS